MGIAAYRLLNDADRADRARSTSPDVAVVARRDAFSLPPNERSTYLVALAHVVDGARDELGLTA